MAGIACIAPDVRRQGLFQRLATSAMMAGGNVDYSKPFLFAGRMAHVITYRTMASKTTGAVPSTNNPLSVWHKDVAVEVAKLFKCEVNRDTLVVKGSGKPVGFPLISYDATPEEEKLFEHVDRARGDSLLSMCWIPSAPAGW